MKRFIVAFIFGSISMLAADAATPAPAAPTPVSPELRAAYWRAAAEMQNADYQDKVAHEKFNASVEGMRESCAALKPARDMSQDANREPTCVARPEVKKDAVKK